MKTSLMFKTIMQNSDTYGLLIIDTNKFHCLYLQIQSYKAHHYYCTVIFSLSSLFCQVLIYRCHCKAYVLVQSYSTFQGWLSTALFTCAGRFQSIVLNMVCVLLPSSIPPLPVWRGTILYWETVLNYK